MCFSSHVSYITSAILFPAGIYGVIKALKCNRQYLLLSLIPVIFSLQQLSEGILWDALALQRYDLIDYGALTYLFFAYLFWPMFIPCCFYFIEPMGARKKILSVLIVCGFILGCLVYIPLITNTGLFKVTIDYQALNYNIEQAQYKSVLYIVCYALIMFYSWLFCSITSIRVLGLLLLASFIISLIWFEYAFTSRWCFFAAGLSLYIVYIMYKLRKKDGI